MSTGWLAAYIHIDKVVFPSFLNFQVVHPLAIIAIARGIGEDSSAAPFPVDQLADVCATTEMPSFDHHNMDRSGDGAATPTAIPTACYYC